MLYMYTSSLSCSKFEIWMPSHKDIILSHILAAQEYSLRGNVNTNLNFVLHLYYFIAVSGVTETQLIYIASPWNASFQFVKDSITWNENCDLIQNWTTSTAFVHISAVDNCSRIRPLPTSVLLSHAPKLCWWIESFNECLWVVNYVGILKFFDLVLFLLLNVPHVQYVIAQ